MEQLNDIEPLAWEFVLNFIKENDLKTDKISYSEIFSKMQLKSNGVTISTDFVRC